MEAYLRVFINWKQDNLVKLLSIPEFAYKNTKNTSTGHTLFEHNCSYYSKVFFKEDVDPCLRSCSTNKLAEKLKKLIEVYCQNLLHAQELQKKAYDKRVKSCSYTLGKKVLLNSKYIKTKRNKKLESKFFGLFQVFYIVEKQAYKLELYAKSKIHNVFYVSLLEQNIMRKKQVDKALPEPENNLEFKASGNKKYEVKAIIDIAVYSQQANSSDQMPGLYYLVL